MDDDAARTTAVFPPPPAVFREYTQANVLWHALLHERLKEAGGEAAYAAADAAERRALQDATLAGVAVPPGAAVAPPTIDLHALAPPRLDWIEEDGGYQLFGQKWPIPDEVPTLEALGIRRLFPSAPFERTEALQRLLRTLLYTYFQLTGDLLRPLQPYDVAPSVPDGAPTSANRIQERLAHIETVVINFQFLVNELRPVQAAHALETLLTTQIERRQEQTRRLRENSTSLRAALAALQL